jgi:hypothetical protein
MSQAATQKSNNTTAIIFAVFAVVCIVAFLFYRGSDVGQLPKLIGNLGGGPLFGSGVVDAFVGLLAGVCVLLSWAGLGALIVRVLPKTKVDLALPIRIAVGSAAWSLVWFLLGLFGGYTGPVALAVSIFGIAAFLFTRGWQTDLEKKPDRFATVLLVIVALALAMAEISAIAPPIAKDALLYHFAVPKAFIAQHSNAFIDGNIASYLSLGTEMHYVWAMLLGDYLSARAGEVAAGSVGFFFLALVFITISRWARELGCSNSWAIVAATIFVTIPTAYHVASSGYIDLSLALYVTLAAYGLTRWWKEQTWGWVILIGIFLGAALSVKLTTVFVLAAFALLITFRARGVDNAGKVVASGFAALVLAGVIASPWYIRTWAATGSPVFPFYMSIWPGKATGWDVERSNLFQAMNSRYGGVDADKVNYLTAPVRMSIAGQPERAENYDGVLGVAFLIGLPLLVWALWKLDLAVEIKIIAGLSAIMYLFWLFSSEQLRYLLPVAPLLAIAMAASAEKIGGAVEKIARCAFVASAVCGLLVAFAWFCMKAPLRVVFGGETRDQYLTRNLDYYPYYEWINAEAPPDARVWLINMRRDTYNIDRPIFSDYLFEDWTLRKMVWGSTSAQELRTKTAAMGIKYVLARHDFLFDYDQSDLVDDKKPRAENEMKLKIAKDFLLDTANTVKADSRFSLIKVF